MTRSGTFEYFEVAADVGVSARGATIAEAAAALARGVFNLIVPLVAVEPGDVRRVAVRGDDEAEVLVNWINELLYLHDTDGWLLADATVEIGPSFELVAMIRGELFDPSRHPRGILVKAATYHALSILRAPEQTTIQMVLDV